jgi:hypothetical protein
MTATEIRKLEDARYAAGRKVREATLARRAAELAVLRAKEIELDAINEETNAIRALHDARLVEPLNV